MGKENYDIDNILSEVKKRKAHQDEPTDMAQAEEQNIDKDVDIEPVKAEESPAEEEYQVLKPVEDIDQPQENEEIVEDDDEFVSLGQTEKMADEDDDEEELEPMPMAISESDPDDEDDAPKKPKKRKKKTDIRERIRKVAIAFLSIVLACLVAFGGYGYFEIWVPLRNSFVGNYDDGLDTTYIRTTADLVESFDPIYEAEANQIASLEDMMKQWYYNGEPCSSSHVYNVMLIGEDTRGSDVLDEGTRADAVIVASVNVDTQEITLTSVLRDTWAYYETEKDNEESGTFNKINSAMSVGDVNTYIRTFERLYKINIDNYVIINFDAFETVVDILGGVTIDVSGAEAREINNHPDRYGNVTIDSTGETLLNGKQALAYCRIRKIDSDNARADRQKECLTEIFNGFRNTSKTNMLRIATKVLPYVKTDLSTAAITNRAEDAFSQDWMQYTIRTTSVPSARINERGASGTFSWAGEQWVWKADFPQDAYNLQTVIYGKSNITLAHTRVDIVNCVPKGFRSQGAAPVSATITNLNYGIVTTTEIEEDEELN